MESNLRATASGGIPGANFTFDFNDAGMTYSASQTYTLLYRSRTSSTFTALGSSTGAGTAVGSDYQLTFGLNTPASGYYTLGLGAVPEPGTLALLAAGLVGLLCYAWRKRK